MRNESMARVCSGGTGAWNTMAGEALALGHSGGAAERRTGMGSHGGAMAARAGVRRSQRGGYAA